MKQLFSAIAVIFFFSCTAQTKSYPFTKTEAEWKKLLTGEQYTVTRKKGTETAYTGKYWNNHKNGLYNVFVAARNSSAVNTNLKAARAGQVFTSLW